MSSGGPKDHFLRFFWESEVFFEEEPFFATPNLYTVWGSKKQKIFGYALSLKNVKLLKKILNW